MSAADDGRAVERDRAGVGEVLRVPEFRGMVLAQVASEAGDQIARVALALLVLYDTGSALLAAATFAVSFVPTFLGAALLGPLADRFSRRSLMLIADVARAVAVGALALVATDGAPLWLLFVLLFVAELFTPLFESARVASIPDILATPAMVTAGLGLTRSLHLANQAVGLVLGGVIVQLTSPRTALFLDAVSFVVSYALLAAFLKRRPGALEATQSVRVLLADLAEGARYLVHDRNRVALVLLGWGMAASLIAPEAVALAYVRDTGELDAWGGVLMAVVVTGAALGSVLVGRLRPVDQLDLVLPLAVVVCVPLLVTGIEPPVLVVAVLWFLAGMATAFMVPVMSFTTLLTANEQRGRVIGIASAGFAAMTAIGYLVGGFLADRTSPAFAVTVMAVVGMCVATVAVLVWPRAALTRAVRELSD